MSHGEHAIIPFNLFFILATVVLWATVFPVWSTLVIAIPVALLLLWFATDKYGGMQLVALLAPACLIATLTIGQHYRQSIETQTEFNLAGSLLMFVGAVVLFPIALFLFMLIHLGVFLAWEWARGKLQMSFPPKPPDSLP